MKHTLPIFAAAVALGLLAAAGVGSRAQSPAPREAINEPARSADVAPEELVQAALARLERTGSISAKVRQRVDVYGQQLSGWGTYLQGPPGTNLLRLELRMQIADEVSSLLEVGDGRTLWIRRDLVDGPPLERIDLARVEAAELEAANRPALPTTGRTLVHGGLPKMLKAVQAAFEFTEVESSALGDLQVSVVHGRWRPAQLAALLPEQKAAIEAGQPVDLSKLASHVPDRVLLFLGRDDLFPYRIEYDRGDKALVTLELFEVTIDGPLDPRQFRYQPGDREAIDRTEQYLAALGLK